MKIKIFSNTDRQVEREVNEFLFSMSNKNIIDIKLTSDTRINSIMIIYED